MTTSFNSLYSDLGRRKAYLVWGSSNIESLINLLCGLNRGAFGGMGVVLVLVKADFDPAYADEKFSVAVALYVLL